MTEKKYKCIWLNQDEVKPGVTYWTKDQYDEWFNSRTKDKEFGGSYITRWLHEDPLGQEVRKTLKPGDCITTDYYDFDHYFNFFWTGEKVIQDVQERSSDVPVEFCSRRTGEFPVKDWINTFPSCDGCWIEVSKQEWEEMCASVNNVIELRGVKYVFVRDEEPYPKQFTWPEFNEEECILAMFVRFDEQTFDDLELPNASQEDLMAAVGVISEYHKIVPRSSLVNP